jgi:hypothetical protein
MVEAQQEAEAEALADNRHQHNERGRHPWTRGRGASGWKPQTQAEGVGSEVRGRYGGRQEGG